jgi:hypothetical protein
MDFLCKLNGDSFKITASGKIPQSSQGKLEMFLIFVIEFKFMAGVLHFWKGFVVCYIFLDERVFAKKKNGR